MPSKKRKVLEASRDEDFSKPRRSSLQVNLSFISNVTNSSRGTSRIRNETTTNSPDEKTLPITRSRIRRNPPSKEYAPPKRRKRNPSEILNIHTNINNQDKALNDSCSQLRDAILRKTREIFDQENEFVIKTSRVLEEGSKMIKSVEKELSKSNLERNSMSVILEKDSRSVIIEKELTPRPVSENPNSRLTIPENEKEKDSRPLDSKSSRLPVKSLKSMILEMSTNTRSILLEKMKESKLLSQTKVPGSTEGDLTPGSRESGRSPSVRVALREDQQVIMSGKNKNSDPVRINVMNFRVSSPVSKGSDQADELLTPKKSRVLDLSNEKPVYPKKRLFSDENNPEDLVPDTFLEPKIPLQKSFLEPEKPSNLLVSPVLSGSTRKRSKLSLRKQSRKDNEKSQRSRDLSVMESLNESDGRISGLPLTCSSFVDDRIQIRDAVVGNFSDRGTSGSSCMEITTVENILPISDCGREGLDKENLEKKLEDSNELEESLNDSQDKRVLSMELTEVEGQILRANSQLVEATGSEKEADLLNESVRTTRTSLNVNTSVDPIEGKESGERDCSTTSFDSKGSKQTKKKCIIRSSLRVNTSLDYFPSSRRIKLTFSKIPSGRNSRRISTVDENEENTDLRNSDRAEPNPHGGKPTGTQHRSSACPVEFVSTSDHRTEAPERNSKSLESLPVVDKPIANKIESNHLPAESKSKSIISALKNSSPESLEDVSLVERLENLFVKPSTSVNVPRTSRSSTRSRSTNSTKDGFSETSYVEGTPLPISRSFLWKSQIKQNTFASNLHFNFSEKSNETNVSEKNHESVGNFGTSQSQFRKGKHPALEESGSESTQPCSKSFGKITTTESSKSSKTEDSSEEVTKKSRKKKLFPLEGRSELLSLSPVKSATPSPKQVMFQNRRKNRKWLKIRNMQKTQKIPKPQKTQKTQKDLEFAKSSTESAEDELENLRIQDLAKRKKPRKVLRKKIVIKKIASSSVVAEMEKNVVTFNESVNSGGRSSLSDFEPKKKVEKTKRSAKRIIVMTGLSNEDKSLVKSVVKKLGKTEMELNVSRKTTHVVTSGVRTINLLKGIIRGCWLVSLEWVLNSLENEDWLDPEPYEMAHFSAAVQENRKDRQLFGTAFVPELFSTCGPIYVGNGTHPTPSCLKELIKTAGGQVTEDYHNAKVVIGSEGVKEIWVLDSITTGELQSVDLYQRK